MGNQTVFEAWLDGFDRGLDAGFAGVANSYVTTFSFGYYNLDEYENQAFRNAGLSEEQQAQSKKWANLSSNAAFGAASGGIGGKVISAASKSKLAGQLANTRLGSVASNPWTSRLAAGAGQGSNALDAAKDATKSVTSFASGDVSGGITNALNLADNLSLQPKAPKGFAKPKGTPKPPEPPPHCFVADTGVVAATPSSALEASRDYATRLDAIEGPSSAARRWLLPCTGAVIVAGYCSLDFVRTIRRRKGSARDRAFADLQ